MCKQGEEVPLDAGLFHVTTPGARLAVRTYQGPGAPVLLLHGGPGSPDYLAPVARLLSPALSPVTFDQRGVGMSEALDDCYSLDAYMADIEVLRTYLGIDLWHVFGHSWGGVLAQLYAWNHPTRVRSLFLCDAASGVGDDWRRMLQAVTRHVLRTAGARVAAAMTVWYIGSWLPGRIGAVSARQLFRHIWRIGFPDPHAADPPDPSWLSGVNRRALHETHRAVLTAEDNSLPGEWSDPLFPVLVLYGDSDIFDEASSIVRDRFPAATQVRLDGVSHFPWIQNAGAFQHLLVNFYDEQEPPLPNGYQDPGVLTFDSHTWDDAAGSRCSPRCS